MEIDDFDAHNDDFSGDSKPSDLELAKLDIIKEIDRVSKELEDNIKYNEVGDTASNIGVLNNYITILNKLCDIQEGELAEGEINQLIDEAKKSTIELNFQNISDVLKDNEDEENQLKKGGNPGGSDNDASLDF